MFRRLLKSTEAAAAVEAAIFAPFFLVLTLGIADLGVGMFVKMTVNAAAQAGASYAVINFIPGSCTPAPCTPPPPVCASLSAACLSGIETAMNHATGTPSFCTGLACSASLTSCADANGGICYTVSANYPYSPILPDAMYTWASAQNYSSTVTVRVPVI